ncbi:MAG: Dihydrofolate synthase [Myxococcaceae bacterium]|nr:Dihydrofolate synthase [Myxococcaceae bacterium]
MDYRHAIEFLYALAPRGIDLSLERMKRALSLRGHPERASPSIVVAGTNGKGSVATMIASVLARAGHKVGLFTSPHLHRLVERFQIEGKPVSERALARGMSSLHAFLVSEVAPPLTFFEICTLLAFELFRAAKCDIIVLEVGLGGRLDATNVVTPLVSVITSIALDHTNILGDTLALIAREKAGIIKPSVPVVVGERGAEARRVIKARATRVKAQLVAIERDFDVEHTEAGHAVWLHQQRLEGLCVPLAGAFQADNLACAVAALLQLEGRFAIDARTLRRGLARVRWPGRLELLEGTPAVLCDAAHNPHAAAALAAHLASTAGHYAKRVLLFGAMRDKQHAEMLALLRPRVDAVVFATAHTPRAESALALQALYGGEAFETVAPALARARKLAGKRGLVVACGSIFVMAEVRALTLKIAADPLIAL